MPLDKIFGFRVLCDEQRAESDKKTGVISLRPCESSYVLVCDNQKIFKTMSEEEIIRESSKSGFLYNPQKQTFKCSDCRKDEKVMKAHVPENLN